MPLIHDVMNAYLSPLLKIHSADSKVTYEDLTSALVAAKAVLADSPNDFIANRVQRMHDGQVKAYYEAAKQSLTEWAHSVALPSIQKGETEDAFVTRCNNTLVNSRPNWHLENESMLEECVKTWLSKRARQLYQQQQGGNGAVAASNNNMNSGTDESGGGQNNLDGDENEEGEIEEGEEGEMEEDNDNQHTEEEEGEEDEEDGEVDQGDDADKTAKTTALATPRKKQLQKNTKKRVPVKKKATIQKKGTPGQAKQATGKAAAGGGKKVVARKKPAGKARRQQPAKTAN